MQHNKIIGKLLGGIFIIPFLISCAPKPTQLFIFDSYNYTDDQTTNTFYITDFYDPSKIQKLDVPVCGDPNAVHVAFPIWSPNGKYYACSAMYDLPLFIKDMNNVTIAKLEQSDPKDPVMWAFGGWSPDSKYFTISYDGSSSKMPYFEIAMMKYDGTGFTQLVKNNDSEIAPVGGWSPNGKYLPYQLWAYVDGQLHIYFIVIDLDGKEITRFDTKQLSNGSVMGFSGVNWSPDSEKLTFSGFDSADRGVGWYVLDIQSGKVSNVIPRGILCSEHGAEWSPDGEKLLIVAHDCKAHVPGDFFDDKIYTVNNDGSNLKLLTNNYVGNAHWTPDGKSIVFDKYTKQGSEIFIMNADGTSQRNLLENRNHVSFMQWITP